MKRKFSIMPNLHINCFCNCCKSHASYKPPGNAPLDLMCCVKIRTHSNRKKEKACKEESSKTS